ncbi:MAG TPA: hypothetical protein H9745_06375 [Candidatus Agathobaculum stercoravium]|nr:hypothetical protein [Candidatus Agathobaculum stercoravium]
MTSREFVLDTLKSLGTAKAKEVQEKAPDMTGTELYAAENYVPEFNPARQYLNFSAGYVCRSAAGRLVKLIQPYDSTIYTGQPEELPAQWGFYWSTDPEKALPFVALATSPYMTGDCCLNAAGEPKRSKIDNNVWSPDTNPEYWEDVTA